MRLIASDLDGTIIGRDGKISDRTVRAFQDAALAGVEIVFVTGRPPRWLDPLRERIGHEGKVICLEYMISQEDFAAGKSWDNLAGRTDLPSIDHISIGFQPHGHEGFPAPHYDMHIYFIPSDQVALIR